MTAELASQTTPAPAPRFNWRRDPRAHFLLITLVALIPRLVYLSQIKSWPFFLYPVLDSRTQWKWAGILLDYQLIGNPEVTAKAPLYQYFLTFCRWLFPAAPEQGLFTAHLLQLTLGAVTCGLVYLLGRRVFSPGVGLLAGLLLALYSPGVYRDGQLLDTVLATLLVTAFTLLLLRAFDQPNRFSSWGWAGLALGLLGATRPNLLLLAVPALVLMILWLRKELDRPSLGRALALFCALLVLPMLLTTARNYLIHGQFLPSSTMGGINLYTGNNPDADGYSPIPSGLAWERTWYVAQAAGAFTNIAMDRYWQGQAFRFWREHPFAALSLYARKLYLFWIAHEIPNNVSYDWGRQHASVLRLLPLTFGLIAPLGLLGLILWGWPDRRRLVLSLNLLTLLLAVAIFFCSGRYRMPAVPLLCVFGAFAVFELLRLLRTKAYQQLSVAVIVLALVAFVVNSDFLQVKAQGRANRDYYYLAQSYQQAGQPQAAEAALRQAVKQHPGDMDAFLMLGQTAAMLGRPEDARTALNQALTIAPDFARAAALLGNLALQHNWPLEEISTRLRRARELQPRNLEVLTALVRMDLRLGDRKQAALDLAATADLLSQRSLADTRNQEAAQLVLAAAAEAQAAGVPIPPSLLQQEPSY